MNSDWRKDYIRYKSFFLHTMSQYRGRADLKAYLEILLSLVTISVFMVFALRPTILTIAQLLKDIEAKREVLAVMDAKVTNLSRAQSLYEQERNKIVLLENAVPKTSEPDVFARQIEGLVGAHAIDITSFTVNKSLILSKSPNTESGSANKDPLPEESLGAEFSVTGTVPITEYSSLSDFLTDFEKLRRPAYIDQVRISRISRGKEKDSKDIVLFIQGKLPYLLYSKNTEVK